MLDLELQRLDTAPSAIMVQLAEGDLNAMIRPTHRLISGLRLERLLLVSLFRNCVITRVLARFSSNGCGGGRNARRFCFAFSASVLRHDDYAREF